MSMLSTKYLANLIKKYWKMFPLSQTDKLSSVLPTQYSLRPGTPVLEVIFNKYLIF